MGEVACTRACEFTEVGYIQLLLLICATIRYHFAWFYYVMIRECCGSAVIVSVSKARCKMRLSLLCILKEVHLVGCGFGNGARHTAASRPVIMIGAPT